MTYILIIASLMDGLNTGKCNVSGVQ